jgi:hypothetical protein
MPYGAGDTAASHQPGRDAACQSFGRIPRLVAAFDPVSLEREARATAGYLAGVSHALPEAHLDGNQDTAERLLT